MNEWIDVHALVDDELAPDERAKVQEYIKKTPQAELEWYAVREVKAVLITKCVQPECEDTWKLCTKRLQEIDRTKRVEVFVGRYSWAICGIFVCVIGGAAFFNRMSGGSLNAPNGCGLCKFGSHFRAPRSQTPDDVRKWLQDNLSKTMQVQPGRVSVVGGAQGQLKDGRRIAEAALQDSDGELKLFVIEKTGTLSDVEPIEGPQQLFRRND